VVLALPNQQFRLDRKDKNYTFDLAKGELKAEELIVNPK
jgi:hypothetical protein